MIDDYCINEFYALKVDYFPEKEEFVFSCLKNNGGIQCAVFDKYLNLSSIVLYEFTDCEYLNGYSVLYFI